ncbi:MAG: cellulase family glycosylhydrolase [Bacteroidales bacterium]
MKQPEVIKINVNTSEELHQMKGGMGASWHVIRDVFPLNNEKYTIQVREVAPLGSAHGGNPPLSNTVAWEQIKNHASWLGMNFIRLELTQRSYLPERGRYDWSSEEMKTLCTILDWAEENGADIFLQQMSMNVEWNAYPGIHPLISAPKDLDAYAEGIATLLEYLTVENGYSCIKYFCMTNEPPGGTWGYWWEYGENEGKIENAWARLKQEFDQRGIGIPISGPDWTDLPPFNENKLAFTKYFGAIDIHSYQGISAEGEEILRRWADWAHKEGKPFFLTEYGNMSLGWGTDDPNQKSFEAALSNASDVMRGMRAGVDAFNRWSFTNRGDMDGQWQLIETFDRAKKVYYNEVNPEPEAYYGFGIISRFLSKYSFVLKTEVAAADSVLMCNALKSPGGLLSVFLLNKSGKAINVEVGFSGEIPGELHLYQVSKEIINAPGFEMNKVKSYGEGEKCALLLPPKSISVITQHSLDSKDKGIVF